MTDAELQAIINDTRSRIVRLYAESYKYFLAGFKILQELQENIEVDIMVKTKELAKKEAENPTENKKKYDTLKRRILPDEKAFSDEIYIDTYRPTGNLVYNQEYFQKLENRLQQ